MATSVAAPLPVLQTDPGKLKIILKNLLGNAIKFTKQGAIKVGVESREEGVEMTVQDTGIGIPPEALSTIFEPFHQGESPVSGWMGGTGLGLAIVQRLVGLLGGWVKVESELGKGSTFRVWVPLRSPARQEQPRAA